MWNLVCCQGYLHALGMSRTAQVKRDARIGEAEAQRDSGIKVPYGKTLKSGQGTGKLWEETVQ